MIQEPFFLTIVNGEGGLQTKSFLLECEGLLDGECRFLLEKASDSIWYIPGYSDVEVIKSNVVHSENYLFDVGHQLFKPSVNFIGSLRETIENALKIFFHKNTIHATWELTIRDWLPSGMKWIPLEFQWDHIQNNRSNLFISWDHSSKYKPDCFSCQMGVRELMNAIEFCKDKIVSDLEFLEFEPGKSGVRGYKDHRLLTIEIPSRSKMISLEKFDYIEEEFAKWFEASFQGTLETAHVDKLRFCNPSTMIIKNLGY